MLCMWLPVPCFKRERLKKMIVTLDAVLRAAVLFAAMARSLSGTVSTIDIGEPTKLMVRAERQFQTFNVARGAVLERLSIFGGGAKANVAPIDVSDLNPGDYVELTIDRDGQVTQGRAIALVECAKVKSADGPDLVLQDGRKLTVGSALRFVTAEGKPSPTVTVQPGEWILLFHHPQTWLIFRVAATRQPETPCPQRE